MVPPQAEDDPRQRLDRLAAVAARVVQEDDRARLDVREHAADDRVDAGPQIVLAVDAPQHHRHPALLEEPERGPVVGAVRRAKQRRARNPGGAQDRGVAVDRAACPARPSRSSRRWLSGVDPDRHQRVGALQLLGVGEVVLGAADLEERARSAPGRRSVRTTSAVYGPGPSSNVNATSRLWRPATATYGSRSLRSGFGNTRSRCRNQSTGGEYDAPLPRGITTSATTASSSPTSATATTRRRWCARRRWRRRAAKCVLRVQLHGRPTRG